MEITVFAIIEEKNIHCEVFTAFKNKITGKSFVVIFSPFEEETQKLIPFLFNPSIDIQDATFLTDEQDKSDVESVLNENLNDIQYILTDDITFRIKIAHSSESEIDEHLKKLAESIKRQLAFPKLNLDEMIKDIDGRIVHLTGEEYFSELKGKHDESLKIISGLIINILQQDVLLTHIPLNAIDRLLETHSITITTQDRKLFKAFKDVIGALGKSEIVRQDVENALVILVECDNCSWELYEILINHKTFSEIISRDILQVIKNNVIYRVPSFFDTKTVESAADYFYSKKEYDNSLILFKYLYTTKSTELDDKKSVDVLNSIGCCCVSLMKFDEACEAFKHATDIDDSYAAAYNNWAYTLAVESDTILNYKDREQKLQEALVYINDAIQRNINDISFISNKTFIEYELGQYDHVIKDYSHAIERTTDYADISTILKLKIDSEIKRHIKFPDKYPLQFSDICSDLQTIFNNEIESDRLYFDALDVYNRFHINNQDIADSILIELIILEFYIKELMSSIAVRNPYQEIYYYTNIDSIYKLLADDDTSIKYRLPIFCVNHMNDPSEGQELRKALFTKTQNNDFLKGIFDETRSTNDSSRHYLKADFTFLKAFTKNSDSLPMWIHYGDSGKGCSIKVSPHFFTNFESDLLGVEKTLRTNPFDNEYRLYEVLYLDDGEIINSVPIEVKMLFKSIVDQTSKLCEACNSINSESKEVVEKSINKMFTKLKYLFKSSDYAYEQEMRIILRRPIEELKRDDIDIQFTSATSTFVPKIFVYTNKSLLIQEIILGPKIAETYDLIPFLTMKLLDINKFNSKDVLISKSAIRYR